MLIKTQIQFNLTLYTSSNLGWDMQIQHWKKINCKILIQIKAAWIKYLFWLFDESFGSMNILENMGRFRV